MCASCADFWAGHPCSAPCSCTGPHCDCQGASAIPVIVLDPSDKWDVVDVLAMFDDRFTLFHVSSEFSTERAQGAGAIVVCPAGEWTPAHLNDTIAPLAWCLLILTSDERSTFDHRAIEHPNLRLWVMTPRPGQHEPGEARYIGEGCPPDTRALLDRATPAEGDECWFGGQVNHASRRDLLRVLDTMSEADYSPTAGFLQGVDRPTYLARLAATRFAPCPAGPGTPDSFRFYEALEAGCVPIVEDRCDGNERPGYWRLVFGDDVPFVTVASWEYLPGFVEDLGPEWQQLANRCGTWWLHRQREQRRWLVDDLEDLGVPVLALSPVTAIVTTSPIPSHPDTSNIEQTVASIRHHLPDAEVLIAVDGVRPEQEEMRPAYDEYLRRLIRLCRRWGTAAPIVADEHVHQANGIRSALELVRTPLVLVVEHDTPLVTDESIPFDEMGDAIRIGEVNSIRLLHEARILEVHEHLMVDPEPVDIEGVPLRRTMQFSARPHLASTAWYRHVLDTYFAPECRTFTEDLLHGVVDHAWRTEGVMGWNLWRLAIYEPPGNAKRSLHTDGRAGGEKYDDALVFAYPGGRTPVGAPKQTTEEARHG